MRRGAGGALNFVSAYPKFACEHGPVDVDPEKHADKLAGGKVRIFDR